ncbi:hypothetical protein KGF56_000651 [Candida oxycetoniae]|uniref:Uncharacterized protein n=1 Tax=Candida oxycetoniae TaxID=497107 RepID=A0AAI9WZX5_9ASCO|nr:uncharacterized protein KGF56_000651 [Candida oxycetoniae]KAI3406519.2 hypothetical protein KGF56_000651 [Candida oxycetoniae]
MSAPSRSPTLSLSLSLSSSAPKTSLIISNLNKNDFIIPFPNDNDNNDDATSHQEPKLVSKNLSLVDQIKLSVLNTGDDIMQHIVYWSVLPFLYRIIVIFDSEAIAKQTLDFLTELLKPYSYIKISLQENLLQRSKSHDQVETSTSITNDHLNVTKSLANFRAFHNDPKNNNNVSATTLEYIEPEPAQFNVLSDLSKLGINLRNYNSDEQLDELKQDEEENAANAANAAARPKSPTSLSPILPQGMGICNNAAPARRRSTKTLFKPELRLDTSSGSATNDDSTKSAGNPSPMKSDFPLSPTITLDETF